MRAAGVHRGARWRGGLAEDAGHPPWRTFGARAEKRSRVYFFWPLEDGIVWL
jgi:hypothetical protein